MDPLQATVAYWRDCIKSEGALEQSFRVTAQFSLHARTKATLFEGTSDPFLFVQKPMPYKVSAGKARDLVERATIKGQEVYFGYPLLMFYDKEAQKHCVAPLFMLRLEVAGIGDDLQVTRGELTPTLGSCAFEKLGLKQEEITALNADVSEIFMANREGKLDTILYLLKKETKLTFIETINPKNLSTTDTINPYDGTVIYNKAVLFASETAQYNIHLLHDLEQLTARTDLHTTALSYIEKRSTSHESAIIPVLPFQFDGYQLKAIQHILGSDRTVVTGPPGTGKSQFIANLIINLFLQKKKVLFVSHTSEAVRVVNERINHEFMHLMMQTGRKDIRQDLGKRLDEMVTAYNDQQTDSVMKVTHSDIAQNWLDIVGEGAYMQRTSRYMKQLSTILNRLHVLERHKDLLHMLIRPWFTLQLTIASYKLRRRRPNYQVQATIKQLTERHVELSQTFVRSQYLRQILAGGTYGTLLAYIDAVQQRKFMTGSMYDKSEKYIDVALSAMNVWACTLKSLAATFPLQPGLFDYVIFDEASQIDLPSAAPALYRAKKVVVVGDENQLTHIAKITGQLEQDIAARYDLDAYDFYPALTRYTDTSLFNSAKRSLEEPEQELKNHYRSHASIAQLFSSVFYGGRLSIHEPDMTLPQGLKAGVHWVDVKGTARKYPSGSRYNIEEAQRILQVLQKLLPLARAHTLSIGVATPYSRQRNIITDYVLKAFEPEARAYIKVLSVHQFQGSEVDILIFSPVLAAKGDGTSDYWYVRNKQILNVAISRAKQLLIIVGDQTYALQSASKLKDIATYCVDAAHIEPRNLPHRPMNVFESRLLDLLQKYVPHAYSIEPQYVVDARFTVDFAIIQNDTRIAVELDGQQHEIIGGLPVFDDQRRDTYLTRHGWHVHRITVYELLERSQQVAQDLMKLLA